MKQKTNPAVTAPKRPASHLRAARGGFFLALTTGVFFTGCAASKQEPRAQSSDAKEAQSSDAKVASPPPLDDASRIEAGGPGQASEHDAPQEEEPMEGEFEEAPSSAPAPSVEKKERVGPSLFEDLSYERRRLDQQLGAEELSCEGAAPILDAICLLADRICKMDDPGSLTAPADCKKARTACKKARGDYGKKCS